MKSEVDTREENEENIREGKKQTLMINTYHPGPIMAAWSQKTSCLSPCFGNQENSIKSDSLE